MNEHYDVVIATPGEWFNQHYVGAVIKTTKLLEKRGISSLWLNNYSSHIGEVRQRIIDDLEEISYNKVFWIDSDIYWNTDQFIRLYESHEDLISGCYITTAGVIAAQDFNGLSLDPNYVRFHRDMIEVQSVGFGFLCMKKGIVEQLDNPMMPMNDVLNEDIAFCMRVKSELGIPIMLDPTVKLDHFRTVPLGWREV